MPLRPALAAVLGALLGLAAAAPVHAQALPFPGAGDVAQEAQVLPVLRRGDGQLEALLLLDRPSIPLNPLDRVLAPRHGALGAAARVRVNAAHSVEAALRLDDGPALALLCNERIGLATTLASLNEHCLLTPLAAAEHDALLGAARFRQLEAGWRNEHAGIDLSFGLSWLDTGQPAMSWLDAQRPWNPLAPQLAGLPLELSLTGLAGARLLEQGVGVRGLFDLGSQRWLSLGGALTHHRLDGLLPGLEGGRSWDSSSLSLGLGQGNLYGELTGHVTELPGSDNALWGGLDIGISWRTPWQGELTVGAQNLLSRGDSPWRLENGQPAGEAETRVPYVRYHQDL